MSDSREFRRVGLVAKRTSREAVKAAAEVAEWLARVGLGDLREFRISRPYFRALRPGALRRNRAGAQGGRDGEGG